MMQFGEVFKLIKTGEVLVRVSKYRVLVCEPSPSLNQLDGEVGKIVRITKKDLLWPCAAINLRKAFYK